MPTSTADEYFNPLNPDHISDPDDLMQSSRIRCPVGRVSDVLYTVNTDLGVRQAFDDTKHLSSKGNFSVGAEDYPMGAVCSDYQHRPSDTYGTAREAPQGLRPRKGA